MQRSIFRSHRRAILRHGVAGALAAACGESTTGRTIRLRTRLAVELPPDRTFATGLGWQVTLFTALLSGGALYYFDGEPAFVRAPSRWRRLLAGIAPIGAAHAHPGHYVAGRAMGQVLEPFAVDLLAGVTALPDGAGVTGPYRSGTFVFGASATGDAAAALGGRVALTSGAARKDDRTIYFSMAADLAAIARNVKDAAVAGCVFDAADVAGDGAVTVTVRPRIWFNLVDFSELASGAADEPTAPPPGSTAEIAFTLGLGQLSAYRFSFAPDPYPRPLKERSKS